MIALLVPEFPGQTHGFFWREYQELRRAGVNTRLISTRRPSQASLGRHDWVIEAERATVYLNRPSPRLCASACMDGMKRARSMWGVYSRFASASLNGRSSSRHAIQLLASAVILKQYCQNHGITHIHVHSCGNAAFIASTACRLGGPTYSLVLHSAIRGFGPGQQYKWEMARFGVAVSNSVRDELVECVGPSLPRELYVSAMGIDPASFRREQEYSAWSSGTLRLASCSRLVHGKGIDTVIDAVKILRDQGIDICLKIIGADGSPGREVERALKAQIVQHGLEQSVQLLGGGSEITVRELLESSHIYVTGARQEAIGVSIMEAMSMGLPIVATRVGGVPELVQDGINGVLVPRDDATAMASAVCQLLVGGVDVIQMSATNRRLIECHFSSEQSAARLKGMLRRAHVL